MIHMFPKSAKETTLREVEDIDGVPGAREGNQFTFWIVGQGNGISSLSSHQMRRNIECWQVVGFERTDGWIVSLHGLVACGNRSKSTKEMLQDWNLGMGSCVVQDICQ